MPKPGIWIKLFGLLLVIATASTRVTGYWAYTRAKQALEAVTLNHLTSIRDIKRHQIEAYFMERLADTEVLATNPTFHEYLMDLKAGRFPGESEASFDLRMRYFEDYFNDIAGITLKNMGFYDIFLIDLKGNILISIASEDDLGTNLVNGKYKDSSLAQAFAKGLKGPAIIDIAVYEPSQEKISSFFASPIVKPDGTAVGVIATQIIMTDIDRIMHQRSGLGQTGETFLIGDDLLLRSDSRFFKEKTVLKRKIDREAPRRALAGKTGTMWLLDYRDVPVLNAYTPVKIPGLHWGLISKIDEAEVLEPIHSLVRQLVFGAVALLVLIAVVSNLMAKKITRPLISLDKKLLTMSASGSYGVAMPIPSKDEIGSLVESFNKMSGTIDSQTKELLRELGERKKAEKHLEVVNKEMESFIYSASHDLKVPLVSIQGMTDLLVKEFKEENLNDDSRLYVKHINDSCSMMSHLINDLLEISRVGRMDIEPEEVDVNELSDQVVIEAQALSKDSGIHFIILPGMPHAMINKKRLYQILVNLVGNAVKFMPGNVKKPRIMIGAEPVQNGMIKFYVRDNGEGIEPGQHEKIFELFHRLHGREVPGTGMGLALVSKIIRNYGGEIGLESVKGEGTTFFFSAPAVR